MSAEMSLSSVFDYLSENLQIVIDQIKGLTYESIIDYLKFLEKSVHQRLKLSDNRKISLTNEFNIGCA